MPVISDKNVTMLAGQKKIPQNIKKFYLNYFQIVWVKTDSPQLSNIQFDK